MTSDEYRGRFAPSPSGPLHMGSLVAALASYLDARAHRGKWLLRIDDIDPPREVAGAADHICHTLAAHGLRWDEAVFYQSEQSPAYQLALDTLLAQGRVYRCDCTRKRLASLSAYDEHCLNRQDSVTTPSAWRVKTAGVGPVEFTDRTQGKITASLTTDGGDFIVRRKDSYWAYQLAAAVDDGKSQGITHVVRGVDLLPTTARQIFLQRCLSIATPSYLHVPLVTGSDGQKLSKQNHAPALNSDMACSNLRAALTHLGQISPPEHLTTSGDLLQFAVSSWNPQKIQH